MMALHAKLGEYIIVARRKDNEWFIGSITGSKAREIAVPLNFLGEGEYSAEIYADAEDVWKKPDHLSTK